LELLGDLCSGIQEPAQHMGRPRKVLAHNTCCVIQSMQELGITADFRQAQPA
jgi:hypothetical protein